MEDMRERTSEVKGFLQQAFTLEIHINQQEEEIESLRALAEKAGGSIILAGKGQGKTDYIGNLVARMVDMEIQKLEQIEKLLEVKKSIESLIGSLGDDRYRMVLTARYIQLKTWEMVAVDCNYSWRQVHNLHNEALEILAEKMIA